MGEVDSPAIAGAIVRRVREDLGMSRAELAVRSGVAPRTLYALEAGQSENIGLGKFLAVLDALGLSMSIALNGASAPASAPVDPVPAWDDLGDEWKIDRWEI